MHINFNFFDSSFTEIEESLTNLETTMASIQQIIEAARAEQDIIKATVTSTAALITEVRQLLAVGNVAEADAFLAEIEENSTALLTANAENTAVAAAVDAINGDPAPTPTL